MRKDSWASKSNHINPSSEHASPCDASQTAKDGNDDNNNIGQVVLTKQANAGQVDLCQKRFQMDSVVEETIMLDGEKTQNQKMNAKEKEVVAGKTDTEGSKRRWTDLFLTNLLFSQDNALEFIQPKTKWVALAEEDVDTIKAAIGDCLVDCIVGAFFRLADNQAMAKRWKVKYEVQVNRTMWLIFKFQNVADCDCVLRGGRILHMAAHYI